MSMLALALTIGISTLVFCAGLALLGARFLKYRYDSSAARDAIRAAEVEARYAVVSAQNASLQRQIDAWMDTWAEEAAEVRRLQVLLDEAVSTEPVVSSVAWRSGATDPGAVAPRDLN